MEHTHSLTLDAILTEARKTWGDKPMELAHIVAALGTVYGDICRQTRDNIEGAEINEAELKKELGNLISSTVRWCNDLGFAPEECVRLSQEAQRRYIQAN